MDTKGEMMVMDDVCEQDLTPEEIRHTLLRLSQHQIDEQCARPAIDALKKIMRAAASASVPADNSKPTE
ncbi:MAG: hypothetical protein ACR2GW_10705 [Pyrinomonadaceae bacterium]|jgi:hypothetical protein|nr:hypothetical protein [Acidobacteriota bacterium]